MPPRPLPLAFAAVLLIGFSEVAGKDAGLVVDHHPPATSSSQAVGDEEHSSRVPPEAGSYSAASTVGGVFDSLHFQRGGTLVQQAEDSWEVEHISLDSAPTDQLGTADSARGVVSDARKVAADATQHTTSFVAPGHKEALQGQQHHKVSLHNMDNVQYYGSMMLGEPPQLMKILFDTGSSDTWVPGIGCTSCGLYSAFDDLASLTAVPMGRNFSNRYDSGSVEGSVIKESVVVGGMAVKGVEMGLVKRQEQHIRGFKADGIVGLAFPSISTTQSTSPSHHPTFVQLLQEQYGPVGDLFSVYLTPSPNQPGSMIIFGGYDLNLVRRSTKTPRGKSRRQTTLSSSSVDSGRRSTRSASSGQQATGQESHEVWSSERRPQQQQQRPRLRGPASREQPRTEAPRDTDVGRGDSDFGKGDGMESGGGSAVATLVSDPGRRKGSGFSGKVGETEGRNGGDPASYYGWKVGLTSESSTFYEGSEVDKSGKGTRMVGVVREEGKRGGEEKEEVGWVAVELQKQGEDTRKSGKQKERLVDDSDEDHEGDEPVIVWTPVVEYRGSLSYWTVRLTGLRIEPKTAAVDSLADSSNPDADEPAGGRQQDVPGDGRNQPDDYQGRDASTGPEMCPNGCQAIVDTGSSLLVPPRSQYGAVMEQVTRGRTDCQKRDGMMTFCSRCSEADFPDIVVSVAVALEGRPGAALRQTEVQRGDDESEAWSGPFQEFRLKPSDYLSRSWGGCEILVGEGRATDIWTLGDVFIKTYMSIFDVANLRVGFVCPDGGRCLGGALASWRPPTRFCWPHFGRAAESAEAGDRHDYCLYLRYNVVGWSLMVTSAVLFVVASFLLAWERNRSSSGGGGGGGGADGTEPTTVVPQALLTSPPFPFLSTGQQNHGRSHPPRAHESFSGAVSAEGGTKSAGGGRDRSGDPPNNLPGSGGDIAQGKFAQEQCDHGPVKRGRSCLPGWTREPRVVFLSFVGRTAAAVRSTSAAVASTANAHQRSQSNGVPATDEITMDDRQHSAVTRRFWSAHDGLGGGGSTVALGTLGSDGMRSRGSTPCPVRSCPGADSSCISVGDQCVRSSRVEKSC